MLDAFRDQKSKRNVLNSTTKKPLFLGEVQYYFLGT